MRIVRNYNSAALIFLLARIMKVFLKSSFSFGESRGKFFSLSRKDINNYSIYLFDNYKEIETSKQLNVLLLNFNELLELNIWS